MFRNAANLVVTGGQFTNIENGNTQDTTSTALWPQVAHGAIFDSAERYPPGRCHPGTRQKIIERITRWINDPDPPQHILWLHGPAGSGKSAIGQSICELLKQYHPDRYGGSFFFSKGNTDRGKAFKLFTTLAYQLAVHLPSLRTEINEALCRDPSLPTKSMDVQLFSLIVQPLLRCPLPSHSPTLIIDGLDECADDQGMDTQRRIIELISESIVEHHIPLRFMIASRPEFWIRDAFEASPIPEITLSLSLREDKDADKDIAAYLTQEFEKIRVENRRIMASVKPPWPPEDVINHFVYQASGQYVYASTVLKFVGKSSRFSDPQEQLRILTSPGPHRAAAFSELDRLYETIIRAYPRWATMQRVLGGILMHANLIVIEAFLGVANSELTFVLDALSALIHIKRPPPLSQRELLLEPIFGSISPGQEEISFCHLSFREFLQDKLRSGQFHIDLSDLYVEIVPKFFDIVHQNIEQSYNTEPNLCLELGLNAYQNAMSSMAYAVIPATAQSFDLDTILQFVHNTTEKLLLLDPDVSMSLFGFFLQDITGIEYFLSNFLVVYRTKAPDRLDNFARALAQFKETSSRLWARLIQVLSSHDNNAFKITPVLTYLNEFCPQIERTTIEELFSIPWHTIPDILSTFEQHRHILRLDYSYTFHTWTVRISHLGEDLRYASDPTDSVEESFFRHEVKGWRTHGEWRHQRSLLANQYLDMLFLTGYDNQKIPYEYLGTFFRSQNLSGLYTPGYLQNQCNLAILTSISEFSRWANLPPPDTELRWSQVAFFLISVLFWFNSQLTNPETLSLLDNHDKTLAPKMRKTATDIFDRHFLPFFIESYSEFWHPSRDTPPLLSIVDEHLTKVCNDYIIDSIREIRIHWHPYLALRDLNDLVKVSCNSTGLDSLFAIPQQEKLSKQVFSHVLNCLSQAQMSRRNSDALLAILHIFEQGGHVWCPPPDVCISSIEYLKKCPLSIISEEEFNAVESIVKRFMAVARTVVTET